MGQPQRSIHGAEGGIICTVFHSFKECAMTLISTFTLILDSMKVLFFIGATVFVVFNLLLLFGSSLISLY